MFKHSYIIDTQLQIDVNFLREVGKTSMFRFEAFFQKIPMVLGVPVNFWRTQRFMIVFKILLPSRTYQKIS